MKTLARAVNSEVSAAAITVRRRLCVTGWDLLLGRGVCGFCCGSGKVKMLNSATLMNVQRGINDEDIAEIILGQNLQSGGAPVWRGGCA